MENKRMAWQVAPLTIGRVYAAEDIFERGWGETMGYIRDGAANRLHGYWLPNGQYVWQANSWGSRWQCVENVRNAAKVALQER